MMCEKCFAWSLACIKCSVAAPMIDSVDNKVGNFDERETMQPSWTPSFCLDFHK